jgi:hypothetical protein
MAIAWSKARAYSLASSLRNGVGSSGFGAAQPAKAKPNAAATAHREEADRTVSADADGQRGRLMRPVYRTGRVGPIPPDFPHDRSHRYHRRTIVVSDRGIDRAGLPVRVLHLTLVMLRIGQMDESTRGLA